MTAKIKTEVKVGQIWQRNEYLGGEMLPNQGFVKIIDLHLGKAALQACTQSGVTIPGNKAGAPRVTFAKLDRFGRRGGYRLHKDV
jgi:hypothetical protein